MNEQIKLIHDFLAVRFFLFLLELQYRFFRLTAISTVHLGEDGAGRTLEISIVCRIRQCARSNGEAGHEQAL